MVSQYERLLPTKLCDVFPVPFLPRLLRRKGKGKVARHSFLSSASFRKRCFPFVC